MCNAIMDTQCWNAVCHWFCQCVTENTRETSATHQLRIVRVIAFVDGKVRRLKAEIAGVRFA